MGTLLSARFSFIRAALLAWTSLALENAALRRQLTICRRSQKRAQPRTGDRVFWVVLRRLWSGWDRALVVVESTTVIPWHRQDFRLYIRLVCGHRFDIRTEIAALSMHCDEPDR